jgi:CheY-like chemotaxis protein
LEQEQKAETLKLRVLVVDDNRDSAHTLSMLLEMMGHEPETAFDGQEGVQMAERIRPDALVVDLALPQISGFEVAQAIRDMPWGKLPALVAVSGFGDPADKSRAIHAGFDAHLTKPVEFSTLEKLLTEVVATRRGG